MNNNDTSDSDDKLTEQENSEQLVWERLQNEALAAQRYRLEQEMAQANENRPDDPSCGRLLEGVSLPGRFMFAALAIFVVGSVVVAINHIW